jgi:hypothetical protein
VNDKLGRMWEEADVVTFKILFRKLTRGTEENFFLFSLGFLFSSLFLSFWIRYLSKPARLSSTVPPKQKCQPADRNYSYRNTMLDIVQCLRCI